ncbi:MAG TPA: hypothetical protein VEB18_01650 [Candidatus Paceibacterota bacterium]|nr:hypothetical protein [Candidatus Paceibacterota bacterium]
MDALLGILGIKLLVAICGILAGILMLKWARTSFKEARLFEEELAAALVSRRRSTDTFYVTMIDDSIFYCLCIGSIQALFAGIFIGGGLGFFFIPFP